MQSSVYESSHENRIATDSAITFGRITSVDIKKRMVEVKTFLGGGILDDMHIPACQWLDLDSHPDGDESGGIPRRGSIGLVFFIGGEPFFFGNFKGLNEQAGAITGDESEPRLREGDKFIGTASGSRVVVKASGIIEMISNPSLKRTFSPKDNRIVEICSNYQLTADGGRWLWENLGSPLNETVFKGEYAANLSRTSVLYEQIGKVDSSTIFKREVGPGVPKLPGVSVPVYSETIGIDGTYKKGVGPLAQSFQEIINPDGSVERKNLASESKVSSTGAWGFKNQVANIDLSDSGDLSFSTLNLDIEALSSGDFKISNPVLSIEGSAAGELIINASEAIANFAQGKFELSGPAGGLVDTLVKITQELIDLTTAMASETHIGNMGYPTAPPINAAQYAKATASLTMLKTILELLKK